MSRIVPAIVCVCVTTFFAAAAAGFEPLPRAAAGDHQVDATALAAAFDAAEQLGYATGMVVARNGHVIGEQHWGWAAISRHQSRSVTKSVTSLNPTTARVSTWAPRSRVGRLAGICQAVNRSISLDKQPTPFVDTDHSSTDIVSRRTRPPAGCRKQLLGTTVSIPAHRGRRLSRRRRNSSIKGSNSGSPRRLSRSGSLRMPDHSQPVSTACRK